MSSIPTINTEAFAAHPALYVPVHKRATSRGATSNRSTTPSSVDDSSLDSSALPVYSIQDLIMLSKSPLSHPSTEQRDHLKDVAPEILLSHKQKKAIQHQRYLKNRATPVAREDTRQPLSPTQPIVVPQRRTVRQGRLPERRRYTKKIDESWRAPRKRTISAAGSPLLLLPLATA
ncbi:hypothetical protein C8R42DRAFT_725930 [Lentinula raphanica]|nr:hypothetical protein C8R42DRAFT_725930 [Lentinula raphanica]